MHIFLIYLYVCVCLYLPFGFVVQAASNKCGNPEDMAKLEQALAEQKLEAEALMSEMEVCATVRGQTGCAAASTFISTRASGVNYPRTCSV